MAQELTTPRGWGIVDAAVAVVLITGVATLSNLERMPQGLGAFLEIRLSVRNVLLLAGFALAWPMVLSACGLYAPIRLRTGRGEWRRVVVASAIGGVLAMVFPLASSEGAVQPIHMLLFAAMAAPVTTGLRRLVRTTRPWTRPGASRTIVIVGSGAAACASYRELQRGGGVRHQVLGFIDDVAGSLQARSLMDPLGGLDHLEWVLTHYVVDEVRITLPARSCHDAFQRAIMICERVGVDFSYPVDAFGYALTGLGPSGGEQLAMKRAFDLAVAAGMLVLLSVPMALIAAAVKLTSRGPVVFAQQRYGRSKVPFLLYKFRTMHVDAEAALHRDPALYEEYVQHNFKLPEARDPRLTPIGRWLRKTSLDELPQLWNVLRGDMSIVGPRPIVPAELNHYGAAAALLLALKPGLTSIWVVDGRSGVGYPRRADLELMYVRHWSLLRDLWIILQTVPAVFRGRGAH